MVMAREEHEYRRTRYSTCWRKEIDAQMLRIPAQQEQRQAIAEGVERQLKSVIEGKNNETAISRGCN